MAPHKKDKLQKKEQSKLQASKANAQTAPPAVGIMPTQRYKVQAEMYANTSAGVSRVVADVVHKMIESNNEGVNNLWKLMVKGDETEEE